MLIIFDLDDTLIETSRDITPRKLQGALDLLIQRGMVVPNYKKELKKLLDLNQTEKSASSALENFLIDTPQKEKLLPLSSQYVYGPTPEEWTIEPVLGAKEVLRNLYNEGNTLVCVTTGVEDIQLNKMKKAGIDISLFYKIIVSGSNKDLHYQNIVDEVKIDPKNVVVCGDRVERDLSGARKMGCNTILMVRGRGLYENQDQKEINFLAHDLYEVEEIIRQLKRRDHDGK